MLISVYTQKEADNMEATVQGKLQTMETDYQRIKRIISPLQEASKGFYNLMEDMIKSGKDIQTAHTYSIALQDVISYLFDLSEASMDKSAKEIKAEVDKTTKAISQIRSWRR